MYNTKNRNTRKNDLFPQIDRVLNEIFNTSFKHLADEETIKYSHPAANVKEHADKYVIEMAVPGMEKSDMNIKVIKNILTISADKEAEDKTYKFKEFSYGKFSRQFRLPQAADTGKISASMHNGILAIDIMKKEEEQDKGPQEITIS